MSDGDRSQTHQADSEYDEEKSVKIESVEHFIPDGSKITSGEIMILKNTGLLCGLKFFNSNR